MRLGTLAAVEKLVYALWRPADAELEAWAADLRGQAARELLAADARGVQVNVADGDVADALVRMTTFDRPIEALVSVWVDSAVGAGAEGVTAVLAGRAARLAGYLVTESVRLRPPATADGARTEGFANLALLRRPEALDRPTWLQRWQGDHTAVAVDTQSTFGYVQDVVVRPITAGAPTVDGIVEELFPTAALTDLHAFFDTGGDDDELRRRMTAMTESVARFSGDDAVLDVVPTSRYVVRPASAG